MIAPVRVALRWLLWHGNLPKPHCNGRTVQYINFLRKPIDLTCMFPVFQVYGE